MKISADYVDLPTPDGGQIRTFLATPQSIGKYPGIICYSDIFQLTGPMLRSCARLAGYGFVVAAPEIYRRIESPGMVIPFDDAGRERGLEDAGKTPVAHFDADCRTVLDYLHEHPAVAPGQMGAAGFCIGGHLAFRAALQPDVRATACFYGTGIHNGVLGEDPDAGSLQRATEIRGELLLVWGALDPHIPETGRKRIEEALRAAGTNFWQRVYQAEHAFMRDEGNRYDPEATDEAFSEMIRFYKRVFTP
jgi:carboxymethylenebutenolidase